jgi:hypothetical protein
LPNNRRDFLAGLASTSLLAAAPFAARGDGAPAVHPAALDDKWDLSWVEKVERAKFRAVFDSPDISDGDALFRAIVWCEQYKEVYGTPRGDMAPVIVFRHQGISLMMGSDYWKRFKIGKEKKVLTPEGKKWAEANPIIASPSDTSADAAKYSLGKFLADGGTVLACNFAFGMVVGRYEKEDKLDSTAARQAAMAASVPGVILQPSGIFAVLRAQEAGCKYIMAS